MSGIGINSNVDTGIYLMSAPEHCSIGLIMSGRMTPCWNTPAHSSVEQHLYNVNLYNTKFTKRDPCCVGKVFPHGFLFGCIYLVSQGEVTLFSFVPLCCSMVEVGCCPFHLIPNQSVFLCSSLKCCFCSKPVYTVN